MRLRVPGGEIKPPKGIRNAHVRDTLFPALATRYTEMAHESAAGYAVLRARRPGEVQFSMMHYRDKPVGKGGTQVRLNGDLGVSLSFVKRCAS